jgi:Putative prokaryotic signal transducing protein
MRKLFSSTDHSLIQSATLALESEGIPSVIQNQPGGALPFIPSAILVDDADYERAIEIVRALEPIRAGPRLFQFPKRAWPILLLIAVLLMVAAMFFGLTLW